MEENDDADADSANFVPQIILMVILTLINAFFASAEMAVVSANKNKIKRLANEGNKKAKAVEKLCSDETKFLSTIQVGITLAGFFSSATAALTLSGNLAVILEKIHVPYSSQIATVLITIILSYITLIFGELLPKRIALRNPETTAMRFAKILLVIKAIFSPFVKILSANTNFLVKITGIEKDMKDDKISDSDIIDVVKEGIEDGTIEEEKSRMIESTLKFYHLAAKDMMTPRVDTFMIDINDNQDENLRKILSEKYTRIPVYQNTRDNIIGIINVKDLLNFFYKGNLEKLNFKSILRDAYFVHEYIEANELFEKMKEEDEIRQVINYILKEHPYVVVVPTLTQLQEWLQDISISWFHEEDSASHTTINNIEEYCCTLADHLIHLPQLPVLHKGIGIAVQMVAV